MVLEIDLSRRLPDVNRHSAVPPEFESYGRVAVLNSGSLWFGGTASSHPPTTKEGFYWALSGSVLHLSPRGAAWGWERHITDDLIRFLADKLSLRRRFRQFRMRGDE